MPASATDQQANASVFQASVGRPANDVRWALPYFMVQRILIHSPRW